MLPIAFELPAVAALEHEIFGPVLHVVRWRGDIEGVVKQVNALAYGLTRGIQTRIDSRAQRVASLARIGNVYVNRNMIGAVVGVQPFGGEGLSGTGPKAGGPLYLYRLLSQRPRDVLARAAQADVLPGPTGGRNVYRLVPRSAGLCLAAHDEDRLTQLAAVRSVGSRAIWPLEARALLDRLAPDERAHVALTSDWTAAGVSFDAVLLHGSVEELVEVQRRLAEREGPVIGVERLEPGDTAIPLERLVTERALSINTAAAGGNASLMAIG